VGPFSLITVWGLPSAVWVFGSASSGFPAPPDPHIGRLELTLLLAFAFPQFIQKSVIGSPVSVNIAPGFVREEDELLYFVYIIYPMFRWNAN